MRCRKRHGERRTATRRAVAPSALPTAGICPGAALAPNATDIQLVRTATLCLVNRERLDHGEHALREDGKLQLAAQGHSQEMAAGNYFRHAGDGGSTPLSRIRRAGYIVSSRVGFAVGENIAFATLEDASPQRIIAAWMASPAHRANILKRRSTKPASASRRTR